MSDTPPPSPDLPEALFLFRTGGVPMLCAASAIEAATSHESPVPLPRVPAHVRGLVTYDHRALVILDLALFLRLEADEDTDFQRTLVVHAGPYRVGIPVERAYGVVHIDAADLAPAGDLFADPLGEYVIGQASTGAAGIGAVLDLERLLEAARV